MPAGRGVELVDEGQARIEARVVRRQLLAAAWIANASAPGPIFSLAP